jgi:diacylglycerol kinase family enzyme
LRTIHFIINALTPDAAIIKKQVYRYFDPEDYHIVLKYSSYKKHTIELTLSSVSEGAEIIVACGGDGTVNEVAQCLVNSSVIMGILPIGSGNGLARHLGIPTKLSSAFKILSGMVSQKIDVGKANEHFFFCNIGVAFSAQLIHCYDQILQRGVMAYTRAFFKAVFSFKYTSFEIGEEETTIQSTPFLLLFSNTDQLGYNKTLTPDASLFDGKLDMVRVERSHPFILSFFLSCAFFGKFPPLAKVNRVQLEEIRLLHHQRPIKIQIDGEKLVSKTGTLQIKVLPRALEVICPALG